MRGWLERFEAKLEGQLRDGFPDGVGGYMDLCVYSILEKEWAESVKAKMEARINGMVAG